VAFDVDDNGEPLGYMKGGALGPMCMPAHEGIEGRRQALSSITPTLQALVAAIAPDADPLKEPKSHSEASSWTLSSEWKEAIFKELDTLVDGAPYMPGAAPLANRPLESNGSSRSS